VGEQDETAALIERKIEKEKSLNIFPRFESVYPFMVQQYATQKYESAFSQELREELRQWFPNPEHYKRELVNIERYKRAVKGTGDSTHVFKTPQGAKARELLQEFVKAGRDIDDNAEAAADAARLRREEQL
jgi:hypothetical protein